MFGSKDNGNGAALGGAQPPSQPVIPDMNTYKVRRFNPEATQPGVTEVLELRGHSIEVAGNTFTLYEHRHQVVQGQNVVAAYPIKILNGFIEVDVLSPSKLALPITPGSRRRDH